MRSHDRDVRLIDRHNRHDAHDRFRERAACRMSKAETIRRLRLGDLKRLLRERYGATLPDDDAGRDDLVELLLPISLRVNSPAKVMRNVIETWAPWMEAAEAYFLLQRIETMPPALRTRTAKDLGKRLNLTNCERERLGLRTIAANDMTDEQMAEWRRLKKNERNRLRMQPFRHKAGVRSQATSLSKHKPWKALGISRASWYRRQKVRQRVRQLCVPIDSYKREHRPVSRSKVRRPKWETAKEQG
jgi:hypothetical protein